MKANVIVFDAGILILSVPFILMAQRAMGRSKGRAFLLGSILFYLAVETASVIGGLKNYYWYATNGSYGFSHYPLGGYIVWLGLVPLSALLLFCMVCATSYLSAIYLLPDRGRWMRSAVAGLLALLLYLIIEPVAVTNHWWTWNLKSFYLIDVPLLGWIVVFLAVFFFTAVYDMTVMEKAEPAPLSAIERSTVRRWLLKTEDSIGDLSLDKLWVVYIYRLLLCFAALVAVAAPFAVLLWAVANRGHIPPGW